MTRTFSEAIADLSQSMNDARSRQDVVAYAFDESEHPRDHGKFSKKAGEKGSSGDSGGDIESLKKSALSAQPRPMSEQMRRERNRNMATVGGGVAGLAATPVIAALIQKFRRQQTGNPNLNVRAGAEEYLLIAAVWAMAAREGYATGEAVNDFIDRIKVKKRLANAGEAISSRASKVKEGVKTAAGHAHGWFKRHKGTIGKVAAVAILAALAAGTAGAVHSAKARAKRDDPLNPANWPKNPNNPHDPSGVNWSPPTPRTPAAPGFKISRSEQKQEDAQDIATELEATDMRPNVRAMWANRGKADKLGDFAEKAEQMAQQHGTAPDKRQQLRREAAAALAERARMKSEIDKEFRAVSREFHPDRNPGDPGAVDRMQKLNTLRDFLANFQEELRAMGYHDLVDGLATYAFDESEHPRNHGKFAKKGSGTTGSKPHPGWLKRNRKAIALTAGAVLLTALGGAAAHRAYRNRKASTAPGGAVGPQEDWKLDIKMPGIFKAGHAGGSSSGPEQEPWMPSGPLPKAPSLGDALNAVIGKHNVGRDQVPEGGYIPADRPFDPHVGASQAMSAINDIMSAIKQTEDEREKHRLRTKAVDIYNRAEGVLKGVSGGAAVDARKALRTKIMGLQSALGYREPRAPVVYAKDAQGREHRGVGEGGGQFVATQEAEDSSAKAAEASNATRGVWKTHGHIYARSAHGNAAKTHKEASVKHRGAAAWHRQQGNANQAARHAFSALAHDRAAYRHEKSGVRQSVGWQGKQMAVKAAGVIVSLLAAHSGRRLIQNKGDVRATGQHLKADARSVADAAKTVGRGIRSSLGFQGVDQPVVYVGEDGGIYEYAPTEDEGGRLHDEGGEGGGQFVAPGTVGDTKKPKVKKPRQAGGATNKMSKEEIDAMVAEQSKTLESWMSDDKARKPKSPKVTTDRDFEKVLKKEKEKFHISARPRIPIEEIMKWDREDDPIKIRHHGTPKEGEETKYAKRVKIPGKQRLTELADDMQSLNELNMDSPKGRKEYRENVQPITEEASDLVAGAMTEKIVREAREKLGEKAKDQIVDQVGVLVKPHAVAFSAAATDYKDRVVGAIVSKWKGKAGEAVADAAQEAGSKALADGANTALVHTAAAMAEEAAEGVAESAAIKAAEDVIGKKAASLAVESGVESAAKVGGTAVVGAGGTAAVTAGGTALIVPAIVVALVAAAAYAAYHVGRSMSRAATAAGKEYAREAAEKAHDRDHKAIKRDAVAHGKSVAMAIAAGKAGLKDYATNFTAPGLIGQLLGAW